MVGGSDTRVGGNISRCLEGAAANNQLRGLEKWRSSSPLPSVTTSDSTPDEGEGVSGGGVPLLRSKIVPSWNGLAFFSALLRPSSSYQVYPSLWQRSLIVGRHTWRGRAPRLRSSCVSRSFRSFLARTRVTRSQLRYNLTVYAFDTTRRITLAHGTPWQWGTHRGFRLVIIV